MIPIVIGGMKYRMRWTLSDMRRLEELCGNAGEIVSIKGSTYKNLVALLWTGLYEDNYKGEQEHVFHQQMHGFKAAQEMFDIIVKEHSPINTARSYVFVQACDAMYDTGWFIEVPEDYTPKPAPTVVSGKKVEKKPTLFYETYQNSVKDIAYGILGLKPEELERYTPAEIVDMATAVNKRHEAIRMEQDVMVATLKHTMIHVAGGTSKVQDHIIWKVEEPPKEVVVEDNSPVFTEEEIVEQQNAFKGWVTATNGSII